MSRPRPVTPRPGRAPAPSGVGAEGGSAHRPRFPIAGGLAGALVLVLILSGSSATDSAVPASHVAPLPGTAPAALPGPMAPAVGTTLSTTLSVGNLSANLTNLFWGTTVNNEVRMFRGETDAVNATPARVLVWPGAMAGEDYNPLTNTHYDTYFGTPGTALSNESQFVEMCKATHCTAIVQLPAEIDDVKLAEQIVNYTEVNLSFIPAYWMIGNEPELWQHWKVPWKNWPTQYTTGPTPTQFANEVLAYVSAIRAVDNNTPILGLPASGCTCGSWTFDQWIAQVLKVTGDKIQAVAFHEYPAGWLGTGNGSLQAFYQTIQSAAGIPTRMVAARNAVQTACPNCSVSVFISELGSALSWSTYGPYAIGFSGSLSLAAQLTQAMDVNLSNIDLFATELATTNSWFDPQGHARADYTLYTSILDHLGTQAFPVNFTGLGHSIYGIDTLAPGDHGRQDLLVVNANISHGISFTPQFAGASGIVPVESWLWNGSIHYSKSNGTGWVEPYTPSPLPQELPGGLPGTYTLPPQSLVLFEAYPGGGTYVRVHQTGVPSPTAWYARVGANFYSTTADNISLLLPTGSYPVGSVPIPLPIGGKEYHPSEQLAPFADSPAFVAGRYSNLTIHFVDQWRVGVNASPGEGGTVTPDVGWWNASQPLTLTATPTLGYAFAGWSGWGPGSANGTSRSITVVPFGRVTEKARFGVGDQVVLWETGLPVGTPWSVTIRGITVNSSSSSITVYELPGTYGFSVAPIQGYRSLPENGGFSVVGPVNFVEVRFVALTPPPPSFPVTFLFSGLPTGTPIWITVRGVTQSTGGSGAPSPVQYQLLNGSYAYHLSYVAGYHPDVPEKTFDVLGAPLTVLVPFVPTVYSVTWQAQGTRQGMNWTVVLNGAPTPATSAWVSASLPNGSYAFAVELPPDYSANPRTGELVISGASVQLYLVFSVVQFPMQFLASGPVSASAWSVRLGNTTQTAAGSGPSFLAANGTYTFDVHPPDGYYAVPSHGNLTVAGAPDPVVIQFHPSTNKPSAALVAALTTGALSASVWIGVSVLAGFAAVRGLRRRAG